LAAFAHPTAFRFFHTVVARLEKWSTYCCKSP
jgi:hypothetical protein